MRKAVVMLLALVVSGSAGASGARLEDRGLSASFEPGRAEVTLREFLVPEKTLRAVGDEFIASLGARHAAGSWASLKFEPTDAQLARMGLPSSRVLKAQRYPVPTMVHPDGRTERIDLGGVIGPQPAGTLGPTAASFAGVGWFGIRPGALLLLLTGGGIGWCSMAHVYGTPGAYKISTAGHCGNIGETATVIAALGNRAGTLNPILLDFGKFSTSHNNGLGDDWAIIDIDPQWQSLVTPTMCFWGGPRGMYTKTGSLAAVNIPRNGRPPTVSVTPDPALAQTIVHYGHGLGAHTLVTGLAVSAPGGTPRVGEAIHWGARHFMFNGYIAPGDSGSGANTATGDSTGANMEAAGIITHIWIDPFMKSGIGIFAGTRSTQVTGALANGQIVPYPIPLPGGP